MQNAVGSRRTTRGVLRSVKPRVVLVESPSSATLLVLPFQYSAPLVFSMMSSSLCTRSAHAIRTAVVASTIVFQVHAEHDQLPTGFPGGGSDGHGLRDGMLHMFLVLCGSNRLIFTTRPRRVSRDVLRSSCFSFDSSELALPRVLIAVR